MTLILAQQLQDIPYLLSDVLIGATENNKRYVNVSLPMIPKRIREEYLSKDWYRTITSLERKIYIFGGKIVLGWAGTKIEATSRLDWFEAYVKNHKSLEYDDFIKDFINEHTGTFSSRTEIDLLGWIFDSKLNKCVPFEFNIRGNNIENYRTFIVDEKCSIKLASHDSVVTIERGWDEKKHVFSRFIGSGGTLPDVKFLMLSNNWDHVLPDKEKEIEGIIQSTGKLLSHSLLYNTMTEALTGGALDVIYFDYESLKFSYLPCTTYVFVREIENKKHVIRALSVRGDNERLSVRAYEPKAYKHTPIDYNIFHNRVKQKNKRNRNKFNHPSIFKSEKYLFIEEIQIDEYMKAVYTNLVDQNEIDDYLDLKKQKVGVIIQLKEKYDSSLPWT